MDRKNFVFDTNRCAACGACQVGCNNANGLVASHAWRQVNTHNLLRHPMLPVFHYSLACNHCDEAPCMANCPAQAYTRDEATGAVIHHAEACIGCRYCTWACPYDAPRFEASKGVVSKCTWCVDRLHRGGQPACAEACPTGALSYDNLIANGDNRIVPGFVQQQTGPRIHLVPLRDDAIQPAVITDAAPAGDLDELAANQQELHRKISARSEWSLVGFTTVVPALVAWLGAHLTTDTTLMPAAIVVALAASGIASMMHLGRKERAWRAITNVKHSWLSREIAFFSLFSAFSLLYLFVGQGWLPKSLMLTSGIATLVSIDRVYRFVRPRNEFLFHSSSALIGGLLLWSAASGLFFVMMLMTTISGALFFNRIKSREEAPLLLAKILINTRAALLIAAPMVLLVWPDAGLPAAAVALAGHLADRILFFEEAVVTNPRDELQRYARSVMKTKNN